MKVGVVQLKPIKGDIEKNIESHIRWIEQAVNAGADMLVFPELSLTGYEPELAGALASNQYDGRLDCLQRLSDEGKIVVGVGLPTTENGKLYVSMIIFQPGRERIAYSKQYLYPTEVPFFSAGCNPLVINFEDEVIAPAVCYELSSKEHNEFAAKNGATIYVASVLNSVNGVDADLRKLSNIAKGYRMVVLMANYVGESGGYTCAGRSSVWDKDGGLLGQLDGREEGLLIFDTASNEVTLL